MKSNRPLTYVTKTHEGGRADAHQKPAIELERAVATCMLFENTFYESGNDIAKRIEGLCTKVDTQFIAELAVKARNEYKLRHVPLFLAKQLAKLASGDPRGLVRKTLAEVIQRPDEMGEFLAIYWKGQAPDKRSPLSAQIKKGLKAAFEKFGPYHLQKWNRDAQVKLRDVMFLVHPKVKEPGMTQVYKLLAEDALPPADTWEVALSSGADKKVTWERLLSERKLGYMALLMNLRNMEAAGVNRSLVESALAAGASKSKALPFRFISAMKHAPAYAQALSDAMLSAIEGTDKLAGTTALLIDVSGSMDYQISGKSELTRVEAAGALSVLLREVCSSVRVFTFSEKLQEVPNIRGIGLMSAIHNSQPHSSTMLASALKTMKRYTEDVDRIIVVTDEQSQDGTQASWAKSAYIVNVAPYKPGLETSNGFYRVNGWSERVVDWIRVEESGRV
jgi:60 kDa SS-A/Ro ribonucleoprotein